MSQGGDMNARFARMNVNAQPFIPNVGAQPFVPGVYPPYGYPAHGMSFFINIWTVLLQREDTLILFEYRF